MAKPWVRSIILSPRRVTHKRCFEENLSQKHELADGGNTSRITKNHMDFSFLFSCLGLSIPSCCASAFLSVGASAQKLGIEQEWNDADVYNAFFIRYIFSLPPVTMIFRKKSLQCRNGSSSRSRFSGLSMLKADWM